jgi:hypothetical protein
LWLGDRRALRLAIFAVFGWGVASLRSQSSTSLALATFVVTKVANLAKGAALKQTTGSMHGEQYEVSSMPI